jgi:hypothetical protein
MKMNKYFLLAATILLVLVGIQTGHAQPPPPPPPTGGPPCWPPPCVPVNGGVIYAIGAAVLFGAYTLIKSLRSRRAA